MLNHRNTVILFVIILVALILADRSYAIHWSAYLVPICLFLGAEAYGASSISSDFHLKAICRAEGSKRSVALTFDDGPGAQTEKVLEILKKFNVKAAFFCIGHRISGKEALLKKIDAEGHIVGNHSYSHGHFFDLKNTGAFVSDLQLAEAEIKKAIGKKPVFFRPPYGVTTPGLARASGKLNYEVIGWNVRSLDTQIKDRQQLLDRIKSRIKPGSIILMHDTVNGIELVLEKLLLYLKENNYEVLPLDQLIQKNAYA